jgi:hypothetical protein
MEKVSFKIKLLKPVCRTPIKPVQAHKNAAKYSRKEKHRENPSLYRIGE